MPIGCSKMNWLETILIGCIHINMTSQAIHLAMADLSRALWVHFVLDYQTVNNINPALQSSIMNWLQIIINLYKYKDLYALYT